MIVTYEKEIRDYSRLIKKVLDSDWLDERVVIVNCNPYYSSRIVHFVNHKISGEEFFQVINFEYPDSIGNVWSGEDEMFIPFDNYVASWVRLNFRSDVKYLFLCHDIKDGKELKKLFSAIRGKTELDQCKFVSPYMEMNSIFKPDIHVEDYVGKRNFEWENPKTFK